MSSGEQDSRSGVEEEYQIIDRHTRELCGASSDVLPAAQAAVGEAVKPELYTSDASSFACGGK